MKPSAALSTRRWGRRPAAGIAPVVALSLLVALSSQAVAQSTVKLKPTKKVIVPIDVPAPEKVGALSAPTESKLDEGAVSEARKTLTWVGFHQASAYSRVFLKTTERAAFDVNPGNGVVRVVLKNARIRLRNNLRFLDTSYFRSAVWRITPLRKGQDAVVEITMREAVPYRVRRLAGTIQLDFNLPSKK